MFKLSKTFDRVAGPKRVADSTKSKIDKFKVYLPLLSCICNPGLRERHWEQVIQLWSMINQSMIKPKMFSSLFTSVCHISISPRLWSVVNVIFSMVDEWNRRIWHQTRTNNFSQSYDRVWIAEAPWEVCIISTCFIYVLLDQYFSIIFCNASQLKEKMSCAPNRYK